MTLEISSLPHLSFKVWRMDPGPGIRHRTVDEELMCRKIKQHPCGLTVNSEGWELSERHACSLSPLHSASELSLLSLLCFAGSPEVRNELLVPYSHLSGMSLKFWLLLRDLCYCMVNDALGETPWPRESGRETSRNHHLYLSIQTPWGKGI